MFLKFIGGICLRIRNIQIDFRTYLDWDHFSVIERWGVLDKKYKLKELRKNVYVMIWSGRPSDNERRWRGFKLYECFLVISEVTLLLLIGRR